MKVGIIGSGIVGQTLAIGFLKHGHTVMVGTRNEGKLADWRKESAPGAKIGSADEAAMFADIIVLAVKGSAAQSALLLVEKQHMNGKIIIDATNPIADGPPENGVLHFFTSLEESLMEQLQKAYPKVKFVKAFNSIGSDSMVNPEFESTPTMFICGNDDGAKKEVSHILVQFGFEPEDMGKAEAARAIEPLCILWCIPGFLHNDWHHAFKLLKK
ncbi:NAD(P)-binding domain-containing protein [Candidatus Woesearchaeota archaeon]|nr:MAG: hypothetical protein QS99_C0001G0013 [archaeon GW2011_AR4]MBS3129224.1 NAD(P)-binding domain-containing protein [Candidatus Woesearchaeota archaeon]HIH38527.1 NAD(P)-binding domain-containing protein [Candidatus Woesearchaeota archaeon]HIH48482.1 NAD(P)-binding domain-containing protein [Candidatus Woesearchaeota archaeon]HIJ02731.1 NAD(P)-binding domain-containing protein [Candidatus Woesearchaeota archaeon]